MAVVLVTGANRGLGLEFTRQLLARGDQVFASCRHPARASALQELAAAHTPQLVILALDVADPRSVDSLAQELASRDVQIDLARLEPALCGAALTLRAVAVAA